MTPQPAHKHPTHPPTLPPSLPPSARRMSLDSKTPSGTWARSSGARGVAVVLVWVAAGIFRSLGKGSGAFKHHLLRRVDGWRLKGHLPCRLQLLTQTQPLAHASHFQGARDRFQPSPFHTAPPWRHAWPKQPPSLHQEVRPKLPLYRTVSRPRQRTRLPARNLPGSLHGLQLLYLL